MLAKAKEYPESKFYPECVRVARKHDCGLVGSHNTQHGRGTLNSMCLVKDSDSKEIWTHNALSWCWMISSAGSHFFWGRKRHGRLGKTRYFKSLHKQCDKVNSCIKAMFFGIDEEDGADATDGDAALHLWYWCLSLRNLVQTKLYSWAVQWIQNAGNRVRHIWRRFVCTVTNVVTDIQRRLKLIPMVCKICDKQYGRFESPSCAGCRNRYSI